MQAITSTHALKTHRSAATTWLITTRICLHLFDEGPQPKRGPVHPVGLAVALSVRCGPPPPSLQCYGPAHVRCHAPSQQTSHLPAQQGCAMSRAVMAVCFVFCISKHLQWRSAHNHLQCCCYAGCTICVLIETAQEAKVEQVRLQVSMGLHQYQE